ncbi:hypothetical protein NX059_007909 [Plenodomus lindquistii]|nr:hypothetical protein NX059_007909 [Plenodomus lindquistii]
MPTVSIKPMSEWEGDFTWDGYFMHLHLGFMLEDFHADDPRTWPLITCVIHTETDWDYRRSKRPPRHLAYEQGLMKDMLKHRPLSCQKGKEDEDTDNAVIMRLFADYPFNFDRKGQLRKIPHLPHEDFMLWMKWMHGSDTSWKSRATLSDAAAAPKEPRSGSNSEKISPETAYEEILRHITAPDDTIADTLDQLKDEIAELKAENEFQRIEAAQFKKQILEDTDDYKDRIKGLRCRVKGLSDSLCQERTQNEAAEQTISSLQDTLQTYRERRDQTANEKIVTIWQSLQRKKGDTTTQKRKVEDDAWESERKLAKMESQDESRVE